METKANYIATGAFTLAVIVGAFGFIFWFQNTGRSTAQATYRVVFDGSVSGLRTGAAVLFNGIRVGEVAELALDAADPHKVVAVIALGRTVPVRADTKVGLQFQGLTGLAEVSLAGGSVDAAPLTADAGTPPTLYADASATADVTQQARDVLARIDGMVAANESALHLSLRNIETVTSTLADNSARLDKVMEGLQNLAGGTDGNGQIGRAADFDPASCRRSRQEHQRDFSRAVAVFQFRAEGIPGLRHRRPAHLGRAEQGDQKYRPASEPADLRALIVCRLRRNFGVVVERHDARIRQRPRRAFVIGPIDDLEAAVLVLDQRRAAFHPIAAIHVADAEIVVHHRVMDMAADHAVDLVAMRFRGQRLLEGADIVHRVLDLVLGPLRQRPVAKAEAAAHGVEIAVDQDGEVVGRIAEERQPARVLDHHVEHVAVHDQITAAVGGVVDRGLDHFDAAKMSAVIIAQEFVVIAGHVDDARALARLAQTASAPRRCVVAASTSRI